MRRRRRRRRRRRGSGTLAQGIHNVHCGFQCLFF